MFPQCYYEYSLSNAADTPLSSMDAKAQQSTNSTDDEPMGFDRICLEPLKVSEVCLLFTALYNVVVLHNVVAYTAINSVFIIIYDFFNCF